MLSILKQYEKFGIKFDHIFAYELTPLSPASVYKQLPDNYAAAYHWINFGVTADKDPMHNPLEMIKQNFNTDDLVIVKLDIDNVAIEQQLAAQLQYDSVLGKLIDHFYFEDHVNQKELQSEWTALGQNVSGTVEGSLQLMTKIRQQGIAAHFWV